MQLAEDLWIAGSYYVDRSLHGELRVVGPHNHLHYGAVGFTPEHFIVKDVQEVGGALQVTGSMKLTNDFLPDPAMGHIRWVRQYIEPDSLYGSKQGKAAPTFAQVFTQKPKALAPMVTSFMAARDAVIVTYQRQYGKHWYGATLSLPYDVLLKRNNQTHGYDLLDDTGDWIDFTLVADTDNRIRPAVPHVVKPLVTHSETDFVRGLVQRTGVEITHLVNNNKTAGFGYGTVFPRDWMESADLGEFDLTPAARRYMYHKALEHVEPGGQGWHEDSVGEYAVRQQDELKSVTNELRELATLNEQIGTYLTPHAKKLAERNITRTMIDIEPRYILGLQRLQWRLLEDNDRERLRGAARYVLDQAEQHSLLTFKPLPVWKQRFLGGEFGHDGNWRDSIMAFRRVGPVVAPYDVNVVLYPEALRLIVSHADELQVEADRARRLERKWQQTADWFAFTSRKGLPAAALALYGVEKTGDQIHFHQLQVDHLDEAYALFYGRPAVATVESFARRLLDPKYFYTKSGPLLVGAREAVYDTTHYHGKVIWTKQTAFVVAGLQRQLRRKDLGNTVRQLAHQALVATAEASLNAFRQLGSVPELHYDHRGRPARYNEQMQAEGPSNLVQLWSAVGARRIIRAYNEATTNG